MSYSIIATYWDPDLSMWREDVAYDFTWDEILLFISFLQEDQYTAIRVENTSGAEVLTFSNIEHAHIALEATITIPGLSNVEDLKWN